MPNWSILKNAISSIIKANNNQEITGPVMQESLLNIIDNIGENATFVGLATPATNPGTHDGPVFYIAAAQGVYPNFGGLHTKEGINILINTTGFWRLLVIPTGATDSDNVFIFTDYSDSSALFSRGIFSVGYTLKDGKPQPAVSPKASTDEEVGIVIVGHNNTQLYWQDVEYNDDSSAIAGTLVKNPAGIYLLDLEENILYLDWEDSYKYKIFSYDIVNSTIEITANWLNAIFYVNKDTGQLFFANYEIVEFFTNMEGFLVDDDEKQKLKSIPPNGYQVFSLTASGLVPKPEENEVNITKPFVLCSDGTWKQISVSGGSYDVFNTTTDGLVPHPVASQLAEAYFLKADGTWAIPPVATNNKAGYMSAADKIKLDKYPKEGFSTFNTAADGLVPKPSQSQVASGVDSYMNAKGEWKVPDNASIIKPGYMSAADKIKLNKLPNYYEIEGPHLFSSQDLANQLKTFFNDNPSIINDLFTNKDDILKGLTKIRFHYSCDTGIMYAENFACSTEGSSLYIFFKCLFGLSTAPNYTLTLIVNSTSNYQLLLAK